MKDTIINLTPPIDGVQYGIVDKPNEGEWAYCEHWQPEIQRFSYLGSLAGECKKVILSTNPKDTRFPYLVMPSKEQELKALMNKWVMNADNHLWVLDFYKEASKGKEYTQEQMENAIDMARENESDNRPTYGDAEIIQSLQPIAKAVRVEMEESYVEADAWGSPVIKYKIKVEQSPEYPQGVVKALEVIY